MDILERRPSEVRESRALIRELFLRSGLERMDLLAEERAVPFYESMPHKKKPGYRLYNDAQ